MHIKRKRFKDVWNGDGWFVSLNSDKGWLLLAFRPLNWGLRYVRLPGRPWTQRLYIGPFEVERTSFKPIRATK